MATWQPTRRDARRFARQAEPGRPYYTVSECVDGVKRYTEWIFTGSRIGGMTCGHMSPAQVMATFGPLTDEKPYELGRA